MAHVLSSGEASAQSAWVTECAGEHVAAFAPADGVVLSDDPAATIEAERATLTFAFTGQNAELEVDASPVEWAALTHLCLPFRGRRDNPDARVSILVRGRDAQGRPASAWASFEAFTRLPVSRPLRVDVRAFVPLAGEQVPTTVTRVAVGIGCTSGCAGPIEVEVGSLIGERFRSEGTRPLQPADARPGVASALSARLDHEVQRQCGPLVGETPHDARRFLYTNAMILSALQVSERREAAAKLTRALLRQQLPDGSFCDVVEEVRCGHVVAPPRCRRAIGSMAWAGIALTLHREHSAPERRPEIDSAIARLERYLVSRQLADGSFGVATEGDISAWLFLRRTGATDAVARVAQVIESRFDERDGYLLKGADDYVPALDVAGNLGVYFLRERQRERDAERSALFARRFFASRSFDERSSGFGDLGAFAINAEWGVGQYAAFDGLDAERAVDDFVRRYVVDGAAAGSSDEFTAGPLIVNHTRPSWSATAWLVHALSPRGLPHL